MKYIFLVMLHLINYDAYNSVCKFKKIPPIKKILRYNLPY